MKLAAERTRFVAAPTDHAWTVIPDMAGYADHVTGLSETTIIIGSEFGAVAAASTPRVWTGVRRVSCASPARGSPSMWM